MPPTLLAIDAGTTGVTALLLDSALRPLARADRDFPQGFPRPGWVEHRAEDILAAVDETLAEIARHPAAARAAALGITNQRETVFALDRRTGRALAPGIVWQDRRTAERCEALRRAGHEGRIRERTGLLLDPYFSATKIEWLLARNDEVSGRAAAGEVVFGTVDTLVLRHLTGGGAWLTDPTNASRTMLFDIEKRAWDPDLCRLFGVDPAWLPEVRPSVGSFGSARIGSRAGIPILGVAGDQQAALFGQGCLEPGSLKITFGTGCFLLLNTGRERHSGGRAFLSTLAVGPQGSSCFALEGSVFIGGALIQFLRDQMHFFESAADSEALAASVPDSGGVSFVPAFTGLGAPYWDPEARGAILGLTRGTTRAHVARAALEAIALQNAELVELLREETGLALGEMHVDGGAAANDLLMQLQADLAGIRVLRPSDLEATGRGAAALAGLGAGLWASPAEAGAARGAPRAFQSELPAAERGERLAAWRAAVRRVLSPGAR